MSSRAGSGEMAVENVTIDLGNGESKSAGVFEVPEGFLAMTFSRSKTFRSRKMAEAWFKREWRRGYK